MAIKLGCLAAPTTLRDAMGQMADQARLDGRQPPVIVTDLFSALTLGRLIASDLPGCVLTTGASRFGDCIAMYDGVKIMATMHAKKTDNGFREHFGVLAEIYA